MSKNLKSRPVTKSALATARAEAEAVLRKLDVYQLALVFEYVATLDQLNDDHDRESALLSFAAKHQPWMLDRAAAAITTATGGAS